MTYSGLFNSTDKYTINIGIVQSETKNSLIAMLFLLFNMVNMGIFVMLVSQALDIHWYFALALISFLWMRYDGFIKDMYKISRK